ncbi:MAG: hypothetical protein A2622_12170 [Bdellovibrionales bacterium RIFCSPHIGHO2_01_FULL_40_29]|nr:MAG: hypothetical protein A2622_12170 [Bdellovibrionales bacterium RIFCSPHIGHO2_01_FULL_40_29]OFZ32945.1 MAG: hypothetical protein A3D17_09475 [Bdellovibrionales bacterium RIFCSPHIGHO2_02_FULL_40_15]
MKTILTLSLVLLTAGLSEAKLSDFNSLIDETSKAQSNLYADLKQNLKETQVAVTSTHHERYLVDTSATINVPTRKGFLTYKKESINYQPTIQHAKKRLALEIDSAE